MIAPMRFLALFALVLCACGDDSSMSDAGSDAPPSDGMVDGSDASTTGPEICDNGVDDDEDGDVDCADIDCAAAPLDEDFGTLEPIPFVDRVRFLWEGAACAPLQIDVEDGAISDDLVGVIQGRVLDEQGNPFAGARIEVLGQSELGYTLSRRNGEYDIAVNARSLTLRFTSGSLIESQRTITPVAGTYTEAPDVVLVEHGAPTSIDTAAGGIAEYTSNDGDGARTLSVVFPAGVTAMVDGAARTDLTFRARELTEGDLGPERMPGTLPESSAYTYAVELSVDEGSDVRFDEPVPVYLDNFLDFEVGEPIPVGSYDRAAGAWVPETDGVVVEILRVTDGLAMIDATGDGIADDAATLAELGVDDDERRMIAARGPGTYWRVAPTHFSVWDFNWPFRLPEDWIDAFFAFLGLDAYFEDTCHPGSEIRVERRALGEDIPIVGTPFTLHYASDRQLGATAARTMRMQVTPDMVPASLERVEVELHVAGRVYRETVDPDPNAIVEITWDGFDRYGRRYQGPAPYLVRIGFVYPAIYRGADRAPSRGDLPNLDRNRFGMEGDFDLEANRTRREFTLWRNVRGTLQLDDARVVGMLGLTLNAEHRFESLGGTILEGSGGRRTANAYPLIIEEVAPDTSLLLRASSGVAADGDVVYVASAHQIWRVEDGVAESFAGNGTPGSSGDGGPGVDATITNPSNLAIGPDGSVYFGSYADAVVPSDNRVRRIGPDGIIETVVGNGTRGPSVFVDEGALATATAIREVNDLVVNRDGALLFVYGGGGGQILEVSRAGTIRRFNDRSQRAPGVPTAQADFGSITALALDPRTGALYVGAEGDGGVVYYARPGGNVRVYLGDNGLPNEDEVYEPIAREDSKLQAPRSIVAGPDGTLWVADDNRVVRLGQDLIMRPIVGGRSQWPSGDGGPAASATLVGIGQLALDVRGQLYLTDQGPSHTLRRIAPSFGSVDASETVVPSSSGRARFVFDSGGRHVRTETGDLGQPVLAFERSSSQLDSVRDADGNSLEVLRSTVIGGGTRVRFTPTEGPATLVHDDDGDGWADRITIEGDSREVTLGYTGEGMLTSMVDRFGVSHSYGYDASGRLVSDGYAGRPSQMLASTDRTVTLTTAQGRPVTYSTMADGSTVARTRTDGVGLEIINSRDADETERTEFPDGTTTRTVFRPDPLHGAAVRVAIESEIVTPSGRSMRSLLQHDVTLSDRRLETRTTTATVAEGTPAEATIVQELFANPDGTATYRATSAEGRVGEMDVDERGQMTELRRPGRHPVRYSYDTYGRVREIRQGPVGAERVLTLDRSALPSDTFEPVTVTDATGQTVTTSFDRIGRSSNVTDAAGTVGMTYDDAARTRTVQPPGRGAHTFRYDDRGMLETYEPPGVGGATSSAFEYDEDGVPLRSMLPDGVTVATSVDDAFRPLGTSVMAGSAADRATSVGTTYDAQGHVDRMSWQQSGANAFIEPAFDGTLLDSLRTTGETTTQVDFTYDGAFRVEGIDVSAGGTTVAALYEFDLDGLPDAVRVDGERFVIGREADGDRTTFHVRGTRTNSTIDDFGSMVSETVTWPAGGSLGWDLVHDRGGRISERTEVGGTGEVWEMSYDGSGRLASVDVDGVERYAYTYDANGNRIGWDLPTGACASGCVTIDDQDRLMRHGSITFDYDDRGRRTSRTVGGSTTTYDYDPFGNLRGVDLPDGTEVRYVVDALGRRIAREVDGTRTHGWVYGTGLSPLGQLDASGRLEVAYIYVTKSWVPDLAVHRDGTLYRIVHDAVGSVRAVVNATTGAVVQEYTYSPYGVIESATETEDVVPFRFAGGLADGATGLVRFGARDYDPEVGRWTAKDPIGFAGGDSNLYAYVAGDPINGIDPTGLFLDIFIDAVAAFGWCIYQPMFGSCDATTSSINCGVAVAAMLTPFVVFGMVRGLARMARGAARNAGRYVDNVICNGTVCRGGGCFPAGTPVTQGDGEQTAIEEIRVGDRVLPSTRECEEARFDDWRRVELEAETEEGPLSVVLLRPPEWLESHRVKVGQTIDLTLDELNLRSNAMVSSLGRASARGGVGCVVTGAIARQSNDLVQLYLEDDSTLEVTAQHRLYSSTRGRWVAAGELRREMVQTEHGSVPVSRVERLGGSVEVFNLEVYSTQRYFVGTSAILAHNVYADYASSAARLRSQLAAREIADGHAFGKHVVARGEFPGVRTRTEFASVIEGVISDPTHVRHLGRGRTAYWKNGVIVIRNPAAADGGTAFAPEAGIAYFWGIR